MPEVVLDVVPEDTEMEWAIGTHIPDSGLIRLATDRLRDINTVAPVVVRYEFEGGHFEEDFIQSQLFDDREHRGALIHRGLLLCSIERKNVRRIVVQYQELPMRFEREDVV